MGKVRRRRDDYRGVLKCDKRIGVSEFVSRREYRKPVWLQEMEEIKERLAAIAQAAKITKEIQTSRIKAGQSTDFVAEFAGNPPPEVSWWFNGNQIQKSEIIQIENNITILTLNDCSSDMEGTYECRVQNKLASDKTKADLVVGE